MLIKKGNLHTGGNVYEGLDILIADGVIKEIGDNLVPDGEVVDAAGKDIYPGFIDPVVYLGCMNMGQPQRDNIENFNPVTPELEIKYSFSSEELMYQRYCQSGITSVGLTPATGSVVGGQTSLVSTWGQSFDDMSLKSPAGLRVSLSDNIKLSYGNAGRFPSTKMAAVKILSDLFYKADKAKIKDDHDIDSSLLPFVKVLRKELPLMAEADSQQEIRALLEITGEYDMHLVITGGYGACSCLESMIDRKISLILGDLISYSKGITSGIDVKEIVQAEKSGLNLCISTTGVNYTAGRVAYLWNLGELMKAGMEPERAAMVMTINPARALCVDHLLGTLEEGKAADIVIFDNNPTRCYDSNIERTIIRGVTVYEGGDGKCCS